MVLRCAILILFGISVIDAFDKASDESDTDGADNSLDCLIFVTY